MLIISSGRAPLPTPLMSEEEWLKNGGLNSVKSGKITDDNNDFVFNYGFNPIKYLADYVQWSHPDGNSFIRSHIYIYSHTISRWLRN